VYLSVISVSKVGKQEDQRDECSRNRENRVQIPSTSPEPGPGQADNTDDDVDNVEKGQRQEDIISCRVPLHIVGIPFEA
jgi:hypothetical protein